MANKYRVKINCVLLVCILSTCNSIYGQDSIRHEHTQFDQDGIEHFSAAGRIWMVNKGFNIDRFACNNPTTFNTQQPFYFSHMVTEDLRGRRKEVVDFKINPLNSKQLYIAYKGNTQECLYQTFSIGGFDYYFKDITPSFISNYDGIDHIEVDKNNFNLIYLILKHADKKITFVSEDGGLLWREL